MRRVLIGVLTVLAVSTAAWGWVLPPPGDGKACGSKSGMQCGKGGAAAGEKSCGESPRRIRLHEAVEVKIIESGDGDDDCGMCAKDSPKVKKAGHGDKASPHGKGSADKGCGSGGEKGGQCGQACEPRRDGSGGEGCGKDGPKKAKGKSGKADSPCCEKMGQGGKDCPMAAECGKDDGGAACMKIMKMMTGKKGNPDDAECKIIIKRDPQGDCRGDGSCRGDDCDRDCPKMAKGQGGKGCAGSCEMAGKCDPRRDCRHDGNCRGDDCGKDGPKMAEGQGGCCDKDYGRDRDCGPRQRRGDDGSCRMQRGDRGQGGCCGCCERDCGEKCRPAPRCDRPCCRDMDGGRMHRGGGERSERPMMRHGGFGRPWGHGGWGARGR